MSMTVRAVSLNDQPLSQPITARFGDKGGTIGRADHNTLALPDAERHISRRQAEIRSGASGYVIKNIGSANPITVRGQSLSHGESTPLKHSDLVRIGGCLLEVIDECRAEVTTISHARLMPARAMASEPGVELDAPLSSGHSLAVLGTSSGAQAAASRLPDDFDPFAQPVSRAGLPAPPTTALGGAFSDLVPTAESASIDDLYGLKCDGGDPLGSFMSGAAAPTHGASAVSALPANPLALFAGPAPPTRVMPTMFDRGSGLHAAFVPPEVASPQPAVPALEPDVPRAAASPDLWAAFCEGAAVHVDLPQEGLNPEMMRVLGLLLRSAVDGTVQLMNLRATTKQELHADMTIIQARDNNPLKFSPDAQSALEQMLRPPMRGFLCGPAAMAEAMQDLVGHAIGTLAGTRAAFEGVLARFEPRALEAKIADKSVVDSLLPMNRKAKLWDLYLQQFEAIRSEAQDDFDALFGKAFLVAYEQQLRRLKSERRPNAA